MFACSLRSSSRSTAPDGHGDFAEVEVPAGHLFALGDNRHEAADCRSSGPLSFEAIIAKAIW